MHIVHCFASVGATPDFHDLAAIYEKQEEEETVVLESRVDVFGTWLIHVLIKP